MMQMSARSLLPRSTHKPCLGVLRFAHVGSFGRKCLSCEASSYTCSSSLTRQLRPFLPASKRCRYAQCSSACDSTVRPESRAKRKFW